MIPRTEEAATGGVRREGKETAAGARLRGAPGSRAQEEFAAAEDVA
jgi:hypothetical protein